MKVNLGTRCSLKMSKNMNKCATENYILKFLTVSSVSRCLERQAFCTPRMYTLSPSKSIKGSNYGEFLKDKNVLLCTRLYKYAPNLESLLTQQYVCVMCTLWSDNTCVFTRFHSVKKSKYTAYLELWYI
jgi:hypothetical protein